eukprot:gb/GFBE01023153.1/.p1 GENE.gb/GFBE01023153.1/~~gb/GFBE01023153.1/.p1  ORF type:complete len:266 (+),score=53.15 gb/GFBE01023153.1/:1-798(+)
MNGYGQRCWMVARPSWELAPDEPAVVEALTQFLWGGAECIVFSNSKAYSLRAARRGDCIETSALQIEEYASGSFGCKPRKEAGDARIIIRTPAEPQQAEKTQSYCDEINSRVYKKRRFTDFTIVCSGREFPCHRAVLAEASPAFEGALGSGMAEAREGRLEIQDADPAIVEAMLGFLYTGKLDQAEGACVDHAKLMSLAHRYAIDALIKECAIPILQNITPDNVVGTTRALRSCKDKPDFAQLYNQLQDKLREQPELLSALMDGA